MSWRLRLSSTVAWVRSWFATQAECRRLLQRSHSARRLLEEKVVELDHEIRDLKAKIVEGERLRGEIERQLADTQQQLTASQRQIEEHESTIKIAKMDIEGLLKVNACLQTQCESYISLNVAKTADTRNGSGRHDLLEDRI